MKTLIRYALLAAGGLLVLLVVAALAISLFVDPDDYRDEILTALSKQTGRQVSLEGELGLGVLPCCSLELGAVAISNPEGWPEPRFLRAESVDVSVRLWPLLTRGELQIGQVTVDGLDLNLIVRPDGAVNWDFTQTAEAAAASDAAKADGATPELTIDGIRIANSSVQYIDQQSGDRYRLEDVRLTSGPVAPGQSGDISLALIAHGLLPEQPVALEVYGDLLLGVDGNSAQLSDLDIQLGQTEIIGRIEIADIEAMAISFDLSVDRLDADRYLGADDEADTATETADDIGDARVEIPVQTLRDMRVNGRLGIGEVIFSGARLSEMDVTVAANDGQMRLHPLTAVLYNGTYAGDVQLDVRGARPRLSVNENLNGIDVAALLTDTGDFASLSGMANVTIKGTASGDTVGELLEQLRGDAGFKLDNGIYHGLDLWYEIRKARALLKKTAGPAEPADPQTELREFAGTLQFADGIMQNRDFQAAVPFIQLTGVGDINMLTSGMDYRLQARVVETPTFTDGESTEELDKLTNLTIPVRLTGAIDSPEIKIDFGELAKETVKETAKEAVKEKVRDRLKKKFNLFD